MREVSRYTHLMPAARYFTSHSTIHIQTRGIGGRGGGLVVVREASRYTHLMPAARYFTTHGTIHIQTRGIGGRGGGGWSCSPVGVPISHSERVVNVPYLTVLTKKSKHLIETIFLFFIAPPIIMNQKHF